MKLPKQSKPIEIPLPVELDEIIGLGDVIKMATTKLGLKPCNSCEKRAAFLNQHFVFKGS